MSDLIQVYLLVVLLNYLAGVILTYFTIDYLLDIIEYCTFFGNRSLGVSLFAIVFSGRFVLFSFGTIILLGFPSFNFPALNFAMNILFINFYVLMEILQCEFWVIGDQVGGGGIKRILL